MNRHTPIIVLALLLLLIAFATGAVPATAQTAVISNPVELVAFVDGLMVAEMATNHVPGAVVVVVKDGEVFFAKGYGYADLESRMPVNPQTTLFRPGSVSKLFVWTAIMQLVEQGKLSLDADVNEYLDFTIPATYPQPITLKNLMAHTPGFEDSGEGLFKINPDEVVTLEEMLKTHMPARVFPPGEVGAYSNYGTALAGYIVERVSGMPFYAYVEQNIFAPLGMTQATFRQPLPPELAGQMASGYNYADGGYVKGSFEYVVAYPAGSLSATGLEMAKFMVAHLQNGRYANTRILNEETAQLMHSQLYAPDPRMDGMAYGFFENTINGERIISHNGDTMLFHTGLYLLPEQNLGLYISTNAVGGAGLPDAVALAFAYHYFPVHQTVIPTPPSDFATRIPLYTGSYYHARSNFSGREKFLSLLAPVAVQVSENNHVLITMEGETGQYVEVEPGLLRSVDDPDREMVLKEGEDGRITLSPSIPFVFIKARWYEDPNLHLLVLLGGAAIFLFTMLSWFRAFVAGLVRKEKQPLLARLARLTASLFGLLYWLFLLIWVVVLSDVNPAFGIPNLFFGTPDWLQPAAALPVLAGVLGVAMVGWTAVAWRKRLWSLGSRLFYSFLTFWGLALLWSLHTWNFLL